MTLRTPARALLPWLILLAGCTANAPKIVVTEQGLVNTSTGKASSVDGFAADYQALFNQTFNTTMATNAAARQVTAVQVTQAGANLAYQFCASFFKTAGTEQQYLLFSRDVIGVVGTLVTGVIGATKGSPAAAAIVGIGSAAALSGISAYSREFLFSEDNVQGVQDLTLSAMAAQTTAVLMEARKAGEKYGFYDSVRDIMEIQAVCEVQSILALVRHSIVNAKPSAQVINGRVSTDVREQVAANAPIVITELNRTSPAKFLQSQRLADVVAAVRAMDNSKYRDSARPLKTANDIVNWLSDAGSDTKHLEDVAKKLGWRGQ